MIDKKKLALIHIVKKELGLSEKDYRDILHTAAGVESAKDLDEEKFSRLMGYFVRSRHYRVNEFGLTLRQKLFIKYLVRKIGWDESHLNNFIGKYYHKPDINGLSKKEAVKVIESLKNVRVHQPAGTN